MKIPSFFGPTYHGRHWSLDTSRCVNWYPEISTNQESVAPLALVNTPGTKADVRLTGSNGIVRGMWALNGIRYIVCGDKVFTSVPGASAVEIGTLETTRGRVSMADNGISASGAGGDQICIVDGLYGYIIDVTVQSVTVITDTDFPSNPLQVAFLDGYFIVINGSQRHYTSDLYDGTSWGGLAAASVYVTPDPIVAIITHNEGLVFAKTFSTEFWYNNGTSPSLGSPWSRVPGGVVDFGLVNPFAMSQAGSALIALGTQNGQFIGALQISGYTATPITPQGIVHAWEKLDFQSATAYSYTESGHTFWVVNFPSDDQTWVYDITTAMWHERSTYRSADTVQGRHVGDVYLYFNGKHYVSDFRSPNVLEMSERFTDDDGAPIMRRRITGVLGDEQSDDYFTISRLVLEGDLVFVNPNDWPNGPPPITIRISTDNGFTWSDAIPASLANWGEYSTRLVWRKLGYGSRFIFDVVAPGIMTTLTRAFME